jgi:hypothetical protein
MKIETGCLVDGDVYGIYTYQRLCLEAINYGWRGLHLHRSTAIELAEEALAYLNENGADPGYRYGWVDGSVYYFSDEEWEIVKP